MKIDKKKHKVASITDVANAAKTSISTVSRYFNNPTMVAPAAAHRIARAAEELSYVRNRAAASTRNKRSGTVGIVIPTLESSIFAEMTESFSSRLLNYDMTMLLTPNLYDRDIEARIVRSFTEHRVDSVVLVGAITMMRLWIFLRYGSCQYFWSGTTLLAIALIQLGLITNALGVWPRSIL